MKSLKYLFSAVPECTAARKLSPKTYKIPGVKDAILDRVCEIEREFPRWLLPVPFRDHLLFLERWTQSVVAAANIVMQTATD